MANVAFLGLGVMGYSMAAHLQQAGHQVTVFNRTAAKAEQWHQQHGGTAAATPAAAVHGASVAFMCLGDDDSVRNVVMGPDGVLTGITPGAVVVDHTTASAALAREMDAACSGAGVGFIDAPVSGGAEGARNGVLTVMAGGDEQSFAAVEPLIKCFARQVRLMGPVGSGQLTKMVNQICVGGVLAGLSEGLHFAQQAGLDAAAVVDVISGGAAQSWQMNNRSATMINNQYDHGFAVDLMVKDLGIVLAASHALGVQLPTTELIMQMYKDVQSLGGGRWDTSSLLVRLQEKDKD